VAGTGIHLAGAATALLHQREAIGSADPLGRAIAAAAVDHASPSARAARGWCQWGAKGRFQQAGFHSSNRDDELTRASPPSRGPAGRGGQRIGRGARDGLFIGVALRSRHDPTMNELVRIRGCRDYRRGPDRMGLG